MKEADVIAAVRMSSDEQIVDGDYIEYLDSFADVPVSERMCLALHDYVATFMVVFESGALQSKLSKYVIVCSSGVGKEAFDTEQQAFDAVNAMGLHDLTPTMMRVGKEKSRPGERINHVAARMPSQAEGKVKKHLLRVGLKPSDGAKPVPSNALLDTGSGVTIARSKAGGSDHRWPFGNASQLFRSKCNTVSTDSHQGFRCVPDPPVRGRLHGS